MIEITNRKGIGWKGTDYITVKQLDKFHYEVTEHRQEKEIGENGEAIVREIRTKVPIEHVINILTIVGRYTEPATYRQIATDLIEHYRLDCDIEAFNGGKNRARYYFPHYYYPLKVAEFYNKVQYYGRGHVRLLNNDLKGI